MCGIAGYINLRGNPADPRQVSRMNDVLQHRGPDGSGVWTEGPVGLGHRRLAIIDTTSAGHQPMISSNKRFVLTYNGEVYNFRELRRELENLGIRFVSSSDSEVVLESLAMWGPGALARFNGMFALALWDRRANRLLLARDRYGIKPLYWSNDQGQFKFASENKAIVSVDHAKRDLDSAALAEYLTFQNYFSDKTLLSGISLFPAGHFAHVDFAPGQAQVDLHQYWDFEFSGENNSVDENALVEELRRLMTQAVGRQLVSDVEVGTYLSGGIDSGSTASIASRFVKDLKSFTCGFDLSSASGLELGYDERRAAEELSALFKTEHYEMVLKAGDMERCLPQLCWHLEEPRVGQSYPNFYASKLASKFVKVVLSGIGGDEVFGGYPWRYFYSKDVTSSHSYVSNYYSYWQRILNGQELAELLGPSCSREDLERPRQVFTDILARGGSPTADVAGQLNASMYLEAKTFLHGLLVVEDKLAMAHTLESRVPFLDNDVVDFALACPPGLRVSLNPVPSIDEGTQGLSGKSLNGGVPQGKKLLRSAARDFLPSHFVDARKQGFSAPDASWFRGESITYVEKTLVSRKSRLSNVVNQPVLEHLVGEHLSGKRNRRLLIWSLLSLESWFDHFG
jgi:asparagine synthase (glutamine-hydrolysing)